MFPAFTTLHNLLEATVALYPADASGAPVLSAPIWSSSGSSASLEAESLTIKERWIKAETRPTGARHVRNHPLVAQYEVSLGRVWCHERPLSGRSSSAGPGVAVGNREYVLDIVWVDEGGSSASAGDWHRETFYGVTISDRDRSSRDVDDGFMENLVFDAQYMQEDGGDGFNVPPLTGEVPYYVRWTSEGGITLYDYDPVTKLFTEAKPGITTGRATISVDGGGSWLVSFAGFPGALEKLELTAAGELMAGEFKEGAPNAGYAPRIDFMYGTLRVASVALGGTGSSGSSPAESYLFSAGFTEGVPAAGAGKYAIVTGGAVRLTLGGTGAVAAEFLAT